MGQLEGKTALITGGGTGIGLAIARRFHEEGAFVVICGRRQEVLLSAARAISTRQERVMAQAADVTVEEQVKSLVQKTLTASGRIDILVNNAGIMRFGRMEEATLRLWETMMRANAYAPWRLMVEVVRHMRRSGGGSIINLSSISGNKAFPNSGVYCTTKAALQMLSQVMAMEVAADGIRINLICPGLVEDTELALPIFGQDKVKDFWARFRPLHPMGRSGKPEDIAEAALFLASDRSSWITGALLPVDGGRHMATNRPAD